MVLIGLLPPAQLLVLMFETPALCEKAVALLQSMPDPRSYDRFDEIILVIAQEDLPRVQDIPHTQKQFDEWRRLPGNTCTIAAARRVQDNSRRFSELQLMEDRRANRDP